MYGQTLNSPLALDRSPTVVIYRADVLGFRVLRFQTLQGGAQAHQQGIQMAE